MWNIGDDKFHLVEAEKRCFICPKCGNCQETIVYHHSPDASPREIAIIIDCNKCAGICWWSRKTKKLFCDITQEELDPDYFALIETISAPQIKPPDKK